MGPRGSIILGFLTLGNLPSSHVVLSALSEELFHLKDRGPSPSVSPNSHSCGAGGLVVVREGTVISGELHKTILSNKPS